LLPRLDLSFRTNPLQGDDCRLRDGCCLLKRQTGRFPCQETSASTDILGETAPIPRRFAKDLIAYLKWLVVAASHFNPPRDVRPEYVVTWLSQPSQAGIQWFTGQSFPVRAIDGYRMNLDQDFIGRRNRLRDLFKSKIIRRSVLGVDNRFHCGIRHRFQAATG